MPAKASGYHNLDPILEHLKLGMDDINELQYSLKRCSGALLIAGTTLHKLNNETKEAQKYVDWGEQMMSFLTKLQIVDI